MGPKKDAKGKDDKKGGKGDKKGALPGKSAKAAKPKKKSWTKIKVKDKLNNAVFIDQKGYEKIVKEAPRINVLTVSTVVDKFKVNGAVARKILKDLLSKGLVKQCGDHNAHFTLYTGAQAKQQDKVEDPKAKKGQDAKPQAEKKGAAPKEAAAEAK
jgi:small subunit ribosomal protein S25e